MTGLETAAVIVAIVFMGIIMLTFLVIMIAVLVVTKKTSRFIQSAQIKLDLISDLPNIGKRMFRTFKKNI